MTAYQKITDKYNLEFDSLKYQQEETLLHILNGRDCLTVLLTGFGKSATYFLLPLLKDEVSLIHFHLQMEKDLQGELK